MVKVVRADDSAARCESRSLPESFIKAPSNLVRRGLFACAEVGVDSCTTAYENLSCPILGHETFDDDETTPTSHARADSFEASCAIAHLEWTPETVF